MTFALAALTLRIVVYSQIRTLVSIVIVLALAILFLWAGNRVLNSVTGAASPPPPTATVKAIVEPPTAAPTPRHRPTATPQSTAAAHRTPKPTGHRPHPTATPNTPPKVFVTDSDTADKPATAFHVDPTVNRFYCWVRNGALPPTTTAVTFNWVQETPTNQFLTQYPVGKSSFAYTGGFYQGYITQTPGTYHCDVVINGQVFGTAHFTVTP